MMPDTLSPATLLDLLRDGLPDSPLRPALLVAISGGMDSTLLLYLCAQLHQQKKLSGLRAVHVHHGLQSQADNWMQHVRNLCLAWQVPLSVHKVSCQTDSNIEETARDARYRAFTQELLPGECLVQAHHGDDQAETLLYRMMRGSGVRGMSGIPSSRPLGAGQLVRPFLAFRRASLEACARRYQLEWVEDESNSDPSFDRNFLRKDILPRLKARWPAAVENLSRLGHLCAEADGLLQDLADMDYAQCVQVHAIPGLGTEHLVHIPALLALSPPRRHLLLREWLARTGSPLPSHMRLLTIINEIALSRPDSQALTAWPGAEVRRYKEFLLTTRPLPPHPELTGRPFSPAGEKGELPMANNGAVRWQRVITHNRAILRGSRSPSTVSLRKDHAFEPFALPGRKGRKTLKKWLNALGVPYWLRERLPVIHCGTCLIAIPGILIADGFQCATGESGWRLSWELPGVPSLQGAGGRKQPERSRSKTG